MEIPRDILWKIWNKIPIDGLGIPGFKLSAEYLKFRALELFNTKLVPNTFLGPYEKYVQIASFYGEVMKASDLHVPVNKVIISCAKTNNFTMSEYIQAIEISRLDVLCLMATQNVKFISHIEKKISLPYVQIYNPEIPTWVYIKLFENSQITFSSYVFGLVLPAELIIEVDKEILIGAAASLDLEKFQKLAREFKGKKKILRLEDYILDHYDPQSSYQLELLVLFGCHNILENYLERDIIGKNIIRSYLVEIITVYNLPRARKEATYEILRRLFEKYHSEKILAGLEYWSWRIYGKSIVHKLAGANISQEFLGYFKEVYADELNKLIQFTGTAKKIKRWCFTYNRFPLYVDITNRPKLIPVVMETINKIILKLISENQLKTYRKNSSLSMNGYLSRHFTPELYLAMKDLLLPESRITYVPTAEIFETLENPEDTTPRFLEPKLRYLS